MKKAALLFIVLIAISYTQLIAQEPMKYEYATLLFPSGSSGMILFISPQGNEEIKAPDYGAKIIGGWTKATIDRFMMFNDFINKKAVDGWEPVAPVADAALFVLLRRPKKE